ncbi:hypothetical protein [Chryseobacterium oranimense]|uniref:hypothetical protein n=1 Tax=Chryseobacterium oranimense TaxID=421058 RepID=UPI002235508F|nr:hypothetical protein [Chryseobacterium oranimense]
MKKILLFVLVSFSNFYFSQSWNLTGNSGTNGAADFIGTTDPNDFVIKTNNLERIRINSSGNIGIGIAPNVNRALNFFGNTEFTTDTTTRDSYHFFNSAQNINGGLDLMWLRYNNYQPNDVGLLTLSAPLFQGDWAKPVFTVRASGKIFMGYVTSISACSDCNDYRLIVKDGIRTEKVKVDVASANGWADYVFKKDYKLNSLESVEKHIEEKGHLPNIPSAKEVKENGINLGEMDAKLLEKIEELTIYVIQLNKDVKQLRDENKELKKTVESLSK